MLVSSRIIWVLAEAGGKVATSPVLLGVSPTILWLLLGAGLCWLELFLPTAFTALTMGLSALMVALVSTIVRSPLLQVLLKCGVESHIPLWVWMKTQPFRDKLWHNFMVKSIP